MEVTLQEARSLYENMGKAAGELTYAYRQLQERTEDAGRQLQERTEKADTALERLTSGADQARRGVGRIDRAWFWNLLLAAIAGSLLTQALVRFLG